jgi:hypothetical protein
MREPDLGLLMRPGQPNCDEISQLTMVIPPEHA